MNSRQKLIDAWPSEGTCYLCGAIGSLCRSHIIPKFVGDWLRQTGVTGRLRLSKTPDRLVEDLPWRYLLCAACEGRFNRFETEVCEELFLPLHARGGQHRFRYGPSFVQFAVSVAWRVLILLQREGQLPAFDDAPLGSVAAAETAWREYLLGARRTPAPHVVHAFAMDLPIDLDTRGRSPFWARWVLRTPSWGSRYQSGSGYILVKMARLLVLCTIVAGPERRQWRNTQLHVDGGAWGVDIYRVPGWVASYLDNGAAKLQQLVEGLSEKQKQVTGDKLSELVLLDADRIAASDAFRAFEADLGLFGEIVFQLPDDESQSES